MKTAEKKSLALQKLYVHHKQCTHCPLNRKDIHQRVDGVGDPNARMLIIGEAPGKTEEEKMMPFVGISGKLLNTVLQQLGISRSDIFITNTVKCRPQDNRTPTPQEIAAYRTILDKEIEIIQPKVICTLGSVATNTLLNNIEPMGKVRGTIKQYKNIPIIPTYHPSYILRNRLKLGEFMDDIQKAFILSQK
jgi:uracil-DNA glycosylase family 4